MNKVKVAYSDVPGDVAVQLLAAAERLELDPGVVETTSDGVFLVPGEVAKEADLETVDGDSPDAQTADAAVSGGSGDPQSAPATEPTGESTPEDVPVPEDVEALKGKGLEEALKEAGLPTSGTKAEKQQRLANARAGAGE